MAKLKFGDTSSCPAMYSSSGGSSSQIESLYVTPTTSAQTITAPSGVDGYNPINVSAVTSSIDNNIVASNIVSGVSILGVNGSATVLNGETINITPTTSQQIITPTSPKNGITQATVAAVTSSIDSNIIAENIKKDVPILGVVGTLESGGGSGKYSLLDRVSDDNDNEIGTVSGFFTDANNVEYAVVCLDAQYRMKYGTWCSNYNTAVTNMPLLGSWTLSWFNCKNTATENTTLILDFCSANNYTSTGCTHCRSKSFTINGITYYGQLLNSKEAFDIFSNKDYINSVDPSASTYTDLNLSELRVPFVSEQQSADNTWFPNIYGAGTMYFGSKQGAHIIFPVLEIPNN